MRKICLVVLLGSFLFNPPALGNPAASELCPGVEGVYDGQAGNLRTRINLICIERKRMAGSLHFVSGHTPDDSSLDASLNLNFSALEESDDELILANFRLPADERRKGSSKSKVSYVRIDLGELKAGHLSGQYMSGNLSSFKNLEARKIAQLPTFSAVPFSEPLKRRDVAGTYEFSTPRWGKSKLVFDVVVGAPVVYILPGGQGQALHLTDGPEWDGSGTLSILTALGNGGEPDDKKLFYLRGHFLDAHRIEFFLMSPAVGVEGPLIATRLAP